MSSSSHTFCKHLGSDGVAQYINVHADGLPFSTVQVLHPSK